MNEDIIITLQRIRCSTEVCGNLKIAMGLKLAIYEIERLRNELTERIHMCDMRSEKILELTNERDEARREVCELFVATEGVYKREGGKSVLVTDPRDIARMKEWDCFKENS